MTRFLLPTLLTLACTAPAIAQAGAPLPGDRVRVSSSAATGRFVVDQIDSEILTLKGADGSLVRVPVASLQRISVSRGRRSGGAGALRGLFIGTTTGAFAGLAIGYMTSDDSFFTREEAAVMVGVMMGGAGALVGALAGAAAPGESWETVPLRSLRAGVSHAGAMTVGYSIRF